jgi:hypothetical protein
VSRIAESTRQGSSGRVGLQKLSRSHGHQSKVHFGLNDLCARFAAGLRCYVPNARAAGARTIPSCLPSRGLLTLKQRQSQVWTTVSKSIDVRALLGETQDFRSVARCTGMDGGGLSATRHKGRRWGHHQRDVMTPTSRSVENASSERSE